MPTRIRGSRFVATVGTYLIRVPVRVMDCFIPLFEQCLFMHARTQRLRIHFSFPLLNSHGLIGLVVCSSFNIDRLTS